MNYKTDYNIKITVECEKPLDITDKDHEKITSKIRELSEKLNGELIIGDRTGSYSSYKWRSIFDYNIIIDRADTSLVIWTGKWLDETFTEDTYDTAVWATIKYVCEKCGKLHWQGKNNEYHRYCDICKKNLCWKHNVKEIHDLNKKFKTFSICEDCFSKVDVEYNENDSLNENEIWNIRRAKLENRWIVEKDIEHPCYVGTFLCEITVFNKKEKERSLKHDWQWREQYGEKKIFKKLGDVDKYLRKHSDEKYSVSVYPFCPRCKLLDDGYRNMSNISRGLQKHGLRQRRGVGKEMTLRGKTWKIINTTHRKSKALNMLESCRKREAEKKERKSEYYTEKEYDMKSRIRTKYYGSERTIMFIILSRQKDKEEKKE